MTDKERTAIAMLKSGCSFAEAESVTRIPYDRLKKLYEENK